MAKSRYFALVKKAYVPIIMGIMLVATLMVFSGCGGGSSLVGRWEATHFKWIEDGESYIDYAEEGELILEFFSDGNGVWIESGRS